MEKQGVSPEALLAGLRKERAVLVFRKKSAMSESDEKRAADLSALNAEIQDIDAEIASLQRNYF
jgi:hypothetical protein